jgi:hypothetical protein
MPLATVLARLKAAGKRVKLDFKEGAESMARALGFTDLGRRFPGSTREAPVDFLGPLFRGVEDLAIDVLRRLRQWSLTGVSISWATPGKAQLLSHLECFGFDVDLCDVPDLEAYLLAALLAPRSITADLAPYLTPADPLSQTIGRSERAA